MSLPTPDDAGLICGFRLGPVQPCDLSATKPGAGSRPLWLHFNLADGRARRWLSEESGIDPAAVKALTESEPRIHLETVGPALVAVLGDLHHDFDRDPEGLGKIHVYVDGQRMITGRRHGLRTPDRLRRDLLETGTNITSPALLFEAFVQRLANTFGDVVIKLADEVDDAEDRFLAGRSVGQRLALGRMRRSIARLRRHMNANRVALSALRGQLPEVLAVEHSQMRQIVERMDAAVQDLELVQERTRLLQEEIAGRLGEATSRNLFVLSTVTTALLPITLVTGIFGMNVGGLPWVNDPHGFRWVMMAILATVSVSLVLLLRRREK